MKKILSLVVVVVFAWAGVAPAHAAPMQQTSPKMTLTLVEEEPDTAWATAADVVCIELDNGGIRCDFNLAVASQSEFSIGRLGYEVHWTDSRGASPPFEYWGFASVHASGTYWYYDPRITFFDNDVASNNPFSEGHAPAAGVGDLSIFVEDDSWGLSTHINITSPGNGAASFSGFFIISPLPIEACEVNYLQLTNDTFTIDPTIEDPLGPEGDPADYQLYTTVIGTDYRIHVDGGPWNDGTTDRGDDVVISWDGETWYAMDEMAVECAGTDETDTIRTIYMTAPSETFYIRVNDAEGQFADNYNNTDPVLYSIGIVVNQAGPPCESQFEYGEGDWVASVQVHGDSDGTHATDQLTVGQWYAIEVASGSWQDEGSPPDRTDMEFFNGYDLSFDPAYEDLGGGSDGVWCQSEDGYVSFIQAGDEDLYLRVNNQTGGFENNTGVLSVNIYASTFTRSPETCETVYDIGALVSSGVVEANQENGKQFAYSVGSSSVGIGIGLEPGAWYYLETTGGAWWWKGSIHQDSAISYDMAVSEDGSTWVSLPDWERSECNVAIDAIGHRGLYFQIPESAAVDWSLRVDDTALWFNNAGEMGWNLYGAAQRAGVNPDGTCDFSYGDIPAMEGGVSALNEDGTYMSLMPIEGQSETYYALLIKNSSAWRETSEGVDRYDVEISTDNGSSWVDLANYIGELCTETLTTGVMTYIKVTTGQVWKIRVNSTSFYDNFGAIGWEAYVAEIGSITDPWTNCLADAKHFALMDTYDYIPPKEDAGIFVNGLVTQPSALIASNLNAMWIVENYLTWLMPFFTTGDAVQRLQPTETYKIETSRGPWTDGEGGSSYIAALSADNGTTWYDMTDTNNTNFPIICGDLDFTGKYYSVYFTMQEGQVWKIRVADDDGEFLDNGGNLAYRLYAVWFEEGGFLPPVDVTIPWSTVYGDACTQPLVRPDSILEVAKWIEYGRLGIQKFIAWCPENTEILLSIYSGLKSVEPFATVSEFGTAIQSMKQEINAYNWSGEGEDFSILTKSPTQSFRMFTDRAYAPISSSNPWESGVVDINSFSGFTMPESYTACQQYLAPQAGTKLAQGVCYASAVMLMTGASFWIQLILDVGIGILCIKAFWKEVQGVVAMATGVSIMHTSTTVSSAPEMPTYRRYRR